MNNNEEKKSIFRKRSNTGKTDDTSSYSELEIITNNLINETIGENGKLEAAFNRMLEKRKPTEEHYVTTVDARDVMDKLITIAVAQRRMIAHRIANSIEFGDLYAKYYKKIEVIDEYTNDAYMILKELKEVQEEYYSTKSLYDNLDLKSIAPEYKEEYASGNDEGAGASETKQDDRLNAWKIINDAKDEIIKEINKSKDKALEEVEKKKD